MLNLIYILNFLKLDYIVFNIHVEFLKIIGLIEVCMFIYVCIC